MAKKTSRKQKAVHLDIEARNAFRLITRAAALTGDEISGDLYHLPITITYAVDEPKELAERLDTHFDVVQYALHLLVAMGFTVDAALTIVFSAKATQEVMREMYAKGEKITK